MGSLHIAWPANDYDEVEGKITPRDASWDEKLAMRWPFEFTFTKFL